MIFIMLNSAKIHSLYSKINNKYLDNMKNSNLVRSFLLVAASLLFFQCTSEYTPIEGSPGADGLDGIDGIDGADGSAAVCISCHSNEDRDPIKEAYSMSVHGRGMDNGDGTFTQHVFGDSPARAACSRCHSNEGFTDQITQGFFNPQGYPSIQSITCTGCHASEVGHRSFDFENDGNDFALRTIDPVELIVDPMTVIDIKNESDLLGKSNTCINCHQPREAVPSIADAVSGKMMITSTRFSGHHGAQGVVLEGIQGAEIAGAVGYPTTQSTHRSKSSCIQCHMSEGTAVTNGGHSFNPTRNACAACHSDSDFPSATSFDRNGFQTEMLQNQETLAALLATVIGQDIAQDSLGVWQPVFEADGITPVTHVGLIVNGSFVLGLYDFVDVQAAWNLFLIEEDRSNGVHNPAYVEALLANSIQAVQ